MTKNMRKKKRMRMKVKIWVSSRASVEIQSLPFTSRRDQLLALVLGGHKKAETLVDVEPIFKTIQYKILASKYVSFCMMYEARIYSRKRWRPNCLSDSAEEAKRSHCVCAGDWRSISNLSCGQVNERQSMVKLQDMNLFQRCGNCVRYQLLVLFLASWFVSTRSILRQTCSRPCI